MSNNIIAATLLTITSFLGIIFIGAYLQIIYIHWLFKKKKNENIGTAETHSIHNEAIGLLIGKNGSVFEDILSKSGVNIKFVVEDHSEFCTCILEGKENNIREAVVIIYQILSRYGQEKAWKFEHNIFIQDFLNHVSNDTLNNSNTFSNGILKENDVDSSNLKMYDHTEELKSLGESDLIPVVVSYISSPSTFWVQNVGMNAVDELSLLTKEMAEFYSLNKSEAIPYDEVRVGYYCSYFNEADHIWYRAEIFEISPLNKREVSETIVGIHILDRGGADFVKVKQIKKLPDHFLKMKFKAIECGLSDIKPKTNTNVWPVQAINHFRKAVTSETERISLLSKIDFNDKYGCPQLTLLQKLPDQNINIADILVQSGHAKYSFT